MNRFPSNAIRPERTVVRTATDGCSRDDDAMIVLDRHNLIYADGPLELLEHELKSSCGELASLGSGRSW